MSQCQDKQNKNNREETMTNKSMAAKTLDDYRKQAACRQARWRDKQQESGIVHTTFAVAESDVETFKKLAAASRDAAKIAKEKGEEGKS